jgi:hypothetical protein
MSRTCQIETVFTFNVTLNLSTFESIVKKLAAEAAKRVPCDCAGRCNGVSALQGHVTFRADARSLMSFRRKRPGKSKEQKEQKPHAIAAYMPA